MATFGIGLGAAIQQRNVIEQRRLQARQIGLGQQQLQFRQEQAQVAQTNERRETVLQNVADISAVIRDGIGGMLFETGSPEVLQVIEQQFATSLQSADELERGGDIDGANQIRSAINQQSQALALTPTAIGEAETEASANVAGARTVARELGVSELEAARGAGLLAAPTQPRAANPQNFLLPNGTVIIIDLNSPTAQEQVAALPSGTQEFAAAVTATDRGGLRTTAEESRIEEQNRQAVELTQNLTALSALIDENPEALGTTGAVTAFTNALSAFPFDTVEFDTGTATTRAMMIAVREAALKTISSDDRFSNLDRIAVGRLFPSTGIFESPENAQVKIAVLQSLMLRRLALNEADLEGLLAPSQIADFAIQGLLTDAEAIEFLTLIHPGTFQ